MKRLEEIKDNWNRTGFDANWDDDIGWLIKQAERVEYLEKENNRYRKALEEVTEWETQYFVQVVVEKWRNGTMKYLSVKIAKQW